MNCSLNKNAVFSILYAVACIPGSAFADRITVGTFEIDQTEVTVSEFASFADSVGLITEAERQGAGMSGVRVGSDVPAGIFETLMDNQQHPTNPQYTLTGTRRINTAKRKMADYPHEKSGPMPPILSNAQNPSMVS